MPKELNFFDTNPVDFIFFVYTLGNLRKELPIWDRNLYISLCIEVLKRKGWTEPVVVVGITIRDVSVEHTRISFIIEIASTIDERIRRINSLIPNFII